MSFTASNLSVDDIRKAEPDIVRFCKQQGFKEESALLKRELTVKKESSILRSDPRLDNGLLRVGGRLSRLSMPEETKYPEILPKDHHVSKRLLKKIHQQVGHSGKTTCCLSFSKDIGSPVQTPLQERSYHNV